MTMEPRLAMFVAGYVALWGVFAIRNQVRRDFVNWMSFRDALPLRYCGGTKLFAVLCPVYHGSSLLCLP